MNWKQLNQAYPQAFLEWVQIFFPNNTVTGVKMRSEYVDASLNGYGVSVYYHMFDDSLMRLFDYFDALGIHVDTYRVDEAAKVLREVAGLETKHGYSVTVKSPTVWEGATYATRREALEAGVMKAFEIREEQIKQKTDAIQQ